MSSFAYRLLFAPKFFHIFLKLYTHTVKDLIQPFAVKNSLGKCSKGELFVKMSPKGFQTILHWLPPPPLLTQPWIFAKMLNFFLWST